MNLPLLTLIGVCLCAVLIAADLWVSARFARPHKRRVMDMELARLGWSAAESTYPGAGQTENKKRYAREFVVGHGVTPARAAMLVQAVHGELVKTQKAEASELKAAQLRVAAAKELALKRAQTSAARKE